MLKAVGRYVCAEAEYHNDQGPKQQAVESQTKHEVTS